MRVGLLINEINSGGGIQKNYKLWFELFKSKGIETYLFVLKKPQEEKIDKNIIYLKGLTNFEKGIRLHFILKKIGKFDLFLVNAEYMKGYLPFKNYFITVHNTWSNKFRKDIKIWSKKYQKIKRKYKNQKLIGISQGVLDDITQNLKIPIKSAQTIYAPHNFELIYKLSDKQIDIDKNFILGIGRLNSLKRFDLLIRSFNDIRDKIKEDLIILGEGKEKENLKQLIYDLNLKNRVKLLGFKSNPYPYIKNASLVVSASKTEGLSRVLVEALILQTPIVSTHSSESIFEIMDLELKEFVVPIDNQLALSKAIVKALKNYPTIKPEIYQKFNQENTYKLFMEIVSSA